MDASERGWRLARPYFLVATVSLLLGASLGLATAVVHGWPESGAPAVWLTRLRPLHTTFAIGWILVAALGGVVYHLPQTCGVPSRFPHLVRAALAILVAAGLAAGVGLATGHTSGREYLEFGPAIGALVLVALVLAAISVLATLGARARPWPVYLWMWATGIVLLPLTLLEAHAHLLSFYGAHVVRDLTVQWKSYGGLIGAWNMLVYGLSIHAAERLAGDRRLGFDPIAFAFYWLGLFNLVLGFAHHTYPVPQSLALRRLSFAVSMTEWVVLAHVLWTGLRAREASAVPGPDRALVRALLSKTTFWMGVNLTLALLISIPALNATTHGTHVTVAHAMGATVGINTTILWAVVLGAILERRPRAIGWLSLWLSVFHIALAAFLACLLAAGTMQGVATRTLGWSFHTAMQFVRPALQAMAVSGAALWLAVAHVSVITIRWLLGPVPGEARLAAPRRAGSDDPREGPPGTRHAAHTEPERPPSRPPGPARRLAWGAARALVAVALGSLPWWAPVAPRLPALSVQTGPGVNRRVARGEAIFAREGCHQCHAPDPTRVPAASEVPAPDLRSAGVHRSDGWRRVHLFEPTWTDPDARMPRFAHLFEDTEEVDDLLAYLATLRTPAPGATSGGSGDGQRPGTSGPLPAAAAYDSGPRPDDPDGARRGDRLYARYCQACHGTHGRGDGPAARLIVDEAAPRDFAPGLFRTRGTTDLPTDDDLFWTLTAGMPGTAMPAFAHLPGADRSRLVEHVKALVAPVRLGDRMISPFAHPLRRPRALFLPDPSEPTPERIERGRRLARDSACARCHGPDLAGLTARAAGMDWRDEAGRPLPRSTDLTRGLFASGGTPHSVYRSLFWGRGGSPMPSYAYALTSEDDRWCLVHYVRALAARPPGQGRRIQSVLRGNQGP